MSLSQSDRRVVRPVALLLALPLTATLACSSPSTTTPGPESTSAVAAFNLRQSSALRGFATGATPVLTELTFRRAFELPPPAAWKPGGTSERPRGGVELYTAAAESVVIVRTGDGHGTGFVVSPDGLIVTNHHVVETGLRHRAGASYAMVHLGRLSPEGVMKLQGEPVEAQLYKLDPVNDLALLKLARPADAPPMAHLKLSASGPKPGLDCAIIGHPSSGMLWTYRPCQVSSIGDFPKDMVNLVLSRLAASGAQQAEIEAFVKSQPPRLIMLTSAQANPGDSGGPVVDKNGALIGVTFAGPGNAAEDKFTYHVHLNEVRRLLASVPAAPMLLVPDPWNVGGRAAVEDLDGDGKPDVLVTGSQQPEVLFFDLDNDTPAALLGSGASLARLVREKKWDFEAAFDLRNGGCTAYYDTDNDGRVDLILMAGSESQTAENVFTLDTSGQWRHEPPAAGRELISPAYLKTAALARRLETLLGAMK